MSEELETNRPERFEPQDWARLLTEYGSGPGHADIVILGNDPTDHRATGLALLGALMTSPEFRSVLIIAPPSRPNAAAIAERARKILSANGHGDLSARVTHRQMETLDAAAVGQLTRSCGDRVLIYVTAAGQFRYPDISPTTNGSSTEDMWVPHVARLAGELATSLARTSSYALLDVGHVPPIKPENNAALESTPGQVISMAISEKTTSLARAIMNIRADDPSSVATALAEIESSNHIDSKAAALLQATALHSAERYIGAWGVLSRYWDDWISSADNGILVELVRIAAAGGESSKAEAALARLDIGAMPIELVELVLPAAHRCGSQNVEEKLLMRLQALRPSSEALASHLVDRAIGKRDWDKLGELASDPELNIEPDERAYLNDLAVALRDDDLETSAERLASRAPRRGASVHLLAGREAVHRRRYPEAIRLLTAIPQTSAEAPRAVSLILDALESALLQRTPEGDFVIPDELLATLVAVVAQQAALVPRDARLRAKLTQLLSADVLGSRGEALLLYLIQRIATEPDREEPLVVGDVTLEEAKRFLGVVATMVDKANPGKAFIVGVGELPTFITTEGAKRLLPILPEALSHMLQDLTSERDVAAAKLVLHAALLACERAGSRREGIFLLRMTAVHFATIGWSQEARDTAEHALSLAADHPDELRVTWALFADVYHRIGNVHEALVGLLLAVSLRTAKLRIEEAWLETHLLVRLLRELGLYDEAAKMIEKAEGMLARTPVWDARLDSIRLSVELRKHDAVQGSAPDAGLMERLASNIRQLLAVDDDVAPPLALLMQLIGRAKAAGGDVPVHLQELVQQALETTSPTMAARLKALGAPSPDSSTVRSLATRIGSIRFSEDAGYDIQAAALVAQRALTRAESLEPWSVVELIDLLTDRTLLQPADNSDVAAVKRGAEYLLERGHIIHLLGLDENALLIRATIEPGEAPLVYRESKAIFDSEAFMAWKRRYPYEYCTMDDPDSVMGDLVRRSVDRIGISASPPTKALVVPDVRLAGFPMNLLRRENDFIGALQPVATAPSLTWLAALGAQPRRSSGRRIAWISDALPDGDDSPALAPVAERLEPIATEHQFIFSRSARVPRDLAGADIAIVTAHGGLLPDARFFQVVRDDANERWSARSIADAVADAGAVVLFVCSAGRHDEHPRARATVGLTRLILANRVRTVVASPWPLDTKVPPRWLPTFLQQLDDGHDINDATHAANMEVSRVFSGNPPHTFAMHVYGDPTYRCPKSP